MFTTYHYVPILKWKMGEYSALAELSDEIKNNITPLIEIPPIPYDFIHEEPARSVDHHLNGVVSQIKDSIGIKKPIFLDMFFIEFEEKMDDGAHPLYFLAEQARQENIVLIPVTGFERNDSYQNEAKNMLEADEKGICIRIDKEYIGEEDLNSRIDRLLKFFGVDPNSTDIILDLKYISSEYERILEKATFMTLGSLPYLKDWRTVTVAGTSFPENLSDIPARSIEPIRRSEWHIWKRILKTNIARKPSFGDYAIAHPEVNEIDPRFMRMSANIRYTTADEWKIYKGRNVRREGYGQFHNLSQQIIDSEEYSGNDFSSGDEYISQCAREEVSCGNATTWRKVGTNHHLTFVRNQIFDLSTQDGS